MNLDLDKNVLFAQALRELDPELQLVRYGLTWESIEVKDGYEKPPKDKFEKRFQELVDGIPLRELRQERSRRLAAVDWVVIRAFSMNTPVTDEWKTYMQALRDLPSTTEDPANVVWPTPPE